MRIITRRIYRAFPELDRYDDDRCERFVRAARRGFVRSAVRMGLVGLAFVVAMIAGLFPLWYAGGAIDRWTPIRQGTPLGMALLMVLIAVPCLGLAPLAGFLTRDFLLRRRVRYVLRARGVCLNCRYTLIGLPVGDGNTVACPECATECHVDPSLGELTLDESGMARYTPSPDALPKPLFLTPGRVRFLRRSAWVIGGGLVFGLPLAWGTYEIRLRKQAAAAITQKPGIEALMALIEAHQPPGVTPEDPNGFERFQQAVVLMQTIDAGIWKGTTPPPAKATHPEFTFVYEWPIRAFGREPTENERAVNEANRALAIQLLEEYRAKGLFDTLRQAADCRRAVEDPGLPPGSPLASYMSSNLGPMRSLARMGAARMHQALERGDTADFADALRSTLALSRIAAHQGLAVNRLVGIAIESLALARARHALAFHPTPEVVAAIETAIAEQTMRVSIDLLIDAERAMATDYLCGFFSDPATVRLGKFSSAIRTLSGGVISGRLGTFAENLTAVQEVFGTAKVLSTEELFARQPAPPQWDESGLVLVDILLPALSKILRSEDQITMERRGMAVLLALAKYRFKNGTDPDSLAALVPEFLPAIPIDPYSGQPFFYVKLPGPDAQGRRYLVYIPGIDGIDDGGRQPAPNNAWFVLTGSDGPTTRGFDFIINDNDR